MRGAGIALIVIGAVAFMYLGLFQGADPEWACGKAPAAIVAVVGYSNDDGSGSFDSCRASAIWETVKATVIGGVLFLGGLVMAVNGAEEEQAKLGQRAAELVAAQQREAAQRAASHYGMRSPDGAWWWDGQQWRPVPPEQRR